jgi:dolichol kinase
MAAKLKAGLTELQPKLQRRHATLAGEIQSELPASDSKSQWLAFKKRIQPKYTELAKGLQRESIHVPSLRPTNWSRSILHVSSGVFGVLCLEVAPHWLVLAVAGAWAAFCWTCEIARRRSPRINALLMKAFAPVAHEHETYKVNSATWYATALILLASTNQMLWGIAGLAVLAIGDPVAGFIGRRWGRTRLLHGRTLEGTFAFFVSATVVTATLFMVLHAVTPGTAFALAAAAGACGAIAELFSLRVDDNFSIPLSAAAGVALMQLLVG